MKQREKITGLFPRQRGNVTVDNSHLLDALIYIAENGCKWRALPEKFGPWHTIYVRVNRWAKNGVLERIFRRLKSFRRIGTRYDKLDLMFALFIHFALCLIAVCSLLPRCVNRP